jgi:hypothetical protein
VIGVEELLLDIRELISTLFWELGGRETLHDIFMAAELVTVSSLVVSGRAEAKVHSSSVAAAEAAAG